MNFSSEEIIVKLFINHLFFSEYLNVQMVFDEQFGARGYDSKNNVERVIIKDTTSPTPLFIEVLPWKTSPFSAEFSLSISGNVACAHERERITPGISLSSGSDNALTLAQDSFYALYW